MKNFDGFKTSRAKSQHQLEDLSNCWSSFLDKLFHDLTTPLLSINLIGKEINRLLPELVKGYQLAVQHNLLEQNIQKKNLMLAADGETLDINALSEELMNFIRGLRPVYKKVTSDREPLQTFFAKEWLEAFVHCYPFSHTDQRHAITCDFTYNFEFEAPTYFLNHLFSCLVGNSLNANAEIKIVAQDGGEYNLLRYQDSAYFTTEAVFLKHAKNFLLKSENEIIPDLGLCRLAQLQCGGDIIYSQETAEIIIQFSKLNAE